ncbi:hypothetical protein GCM10028821_48840 [Hymenobacter jeollabukensis]
MRAVHKPQRAVQHEAVHEPRHEFHSQKREPGKGQTGRQIHEGLTADARRCLQTPLRPAKMNGSKPEDTQLNSKK